MGCGSFTRRQALLTGAMMIAASKARAHNGVIHVTVNKLEFTPREVTAKPGETIEWTNMDPIAHTATVKGGWDVIIAPGKVATRTVEATDTVDYYCRYHPNMNGRIVVVSA